MDKGKNQKSTKQIKHKNVLETLKDVGKGTTQTVKKDLLQETSKDFIKELIGIRPTRKTSGEILPGQAIEVDEVLSGKHEENEKLRKQVSQERRLRQEEKELTRRQSQEVRLKLQALQNEVMKLAEATEELGEETKIAALQAPIEPGVYHVTFFEKMLSFIKSFRKKVNQASVWLQATNKRAKKKNYWDKYEKHGSKFLLAPDHYLTRSAG